MLRFRDPSRLFRGAILGILNLLILGKPAERRGRKATGLKRGAMTAGLPAGRKLIVGLIFEKPPRPMGCEEREQGEQQRPRGARDVVPVGRSEGFCLALGKRVIRLASRALRAHKRQSSAKGPQVGTARGSARHERYFLFKARRSCPAI